MQRALSIRQPWAWLILNGYKDLENRTWRTDYRGPLLIHAGMRVETDKDAVEWAFHLAAQIYDESVIKIRQCYEQEKTLGGLLGSVVLVDCVDESPSAWFAGPHAFKLINPVLWPKPVPYKGLLGFFSVPDDVRTLPQAQDIRGLFAENPIDIEEWGKDMRK